MVIKDSYFKASTALYFSVILFFIYYFLGMKYFLASLVLAIGLIFSLIDMRFALYGISFFIPFLPNSIALASLLGLGLVFFLRRILKNHEKLESSPMIAIVLVYFLMITIQTVSSFDPRGSLRDLGLHMAGIIYFLVIVNTIRDKKDLNTFLTLIFASATLVALIGLAQAIVGVEMQSEWVDVQNNPDMRLRVYSVFGNPNILAEYLVMTIPIGVGLFWHTKSLKKKTVFLIALAIMFSCLGLTMSRGGWVGIAMAALVFVILVDRRLLLLAFPIAILALVFLPDAILNRLLSIGNLSDTSNAYRLDIWRITGEIIRDHPIAGLGLGHLPFSDIFNTYIRTMPIYHAHNTILQLLVEYGLAGFSIFAMMMYAYIKNPIKYAIVNNHSDLYIKYITAGVLAGLVGVFTQGIVEVVLYLPKIIFMFWMLLAILYILCKMARPASKEQI